MNLEYSEEQVLLRDSIVRWAQDNYSFDQRRASTEKTEGFEPKHWQTFADLGWLSIPFAEDFGGYGGSIIDVAAIMQELGRALVVEPVVPNVVMFGGLLEASSATDKAEILGELIGGSLMGAVALYEQQSRFDVVNVATTATADGDAYRLNGTKVCVLAAPSSSKLLVLARTSGEQTERDGLSVFLLDTQADGVTRQGYPLMDGQQAADITFTDARAELVSELGQGLSLVEDMLTRTHVALSAEAVGIMEKLNQTTVAYTKTRKQFGVPISSFQALQHRMVDTFMAFEQAKSLLVGTLCELTDEASSEHDKAKMVAGLRTMIAKNGKLIGDEAIQLHGGMGLTDELDVGHYVKRLMMINLMFGDRAFFQNQFNKLAYAV
ncbi:acyl-CoA dehydrogenase short-chain specific [Arenicella chitinivorans]|uniref:Acyl-CoA dehydrogenase short-chain specific n=1 Tax=Arenicella chitinivorans TaxID=1329800 RepID=A0A918VH65_9GAMM|nr:acyl-CoA dehydrogenase family protein [Arenicella chitinivorans]GGZ98619.1 acyl-CoA dehydrogenase short-chain specific [Arenicella chitinivorans]